MFESLKKELSRRSLLHKVGFGFMGLSVAGTLGHIIKPARTLAQSEAAPSNEPSSVPPNKKLGWAVVGLGKFATQQIMPSFAECKSSKLVALVSGDSAKAEKYAKQYGVNPKNIYKYQNYDSIRNNPEVDIIYIILPNGMHAEYSIRGAQAGKHIMCEKPMANTVEECQAMIDAAKKANRKLMIAYRAQYEPYNLATIQLAQSGKLGKLKLITSDHGRNLNPKDPADVWRMQKKLAGGGSLYDIGVYSLQAARYITREEPVAISAMTYSTPDDPRFREVEENVNFVLRFPSGVLANCTSSYGYSNTKRIQVFGSDAVLELDPATDYYKHRLTIKDKNGNQEQKIEEKNQFALEMDHLSESIIQNKQPKTPGEEGLQDVKLMQLIYEAARTGKTIKV
ncbi:glucose-fructose oxidoreductase [Brasilonema sp. UFV-L1]|nr:glucose-fructose oxidoreductase [Brasilonema sp. UFV-L1]